MFTRLADCAYRGGLFASCFVRDVTGAAESGLDYLLRESETVDVASRSLQDKFAETCEVFSRLGFSASLVTQTGYQLFTNRDRDSLSMLGAATGYAGYTATHAGLCVVRDALCTVHNLADFTVSVLAP